MRQIQAYISTLNSACYLGLIFTLCILGPKCLLAQSQLEEQLKSATAERLLDLRKSSEIAQQVFEEARSQGNDTLALDALRLMGWNAQAEGDYKTSISYFERVIREAASHYSRKKLGYAYGRLGKSYAELGDYKAAMPMLLKYDSINSSLSSPTVNIEPKLLLGELYEYMLQPEKANAYYVEAYQQARANGSRFSRIQALYYLLDFNLIRQKKQGFEREMEEYLGLLEEQEKDGSLSFNHAQMLFFGLNPEEKINFMEKRLKNPGPGVSLLNRYFYISELINAYRETNQITKALHTARRAQTEFYSQHNVPIKISIHAILAMLLEETGSYKEANYHLKRMHAIRDSLHSVEINKYVDSLEVLYQTAEKDAQLTQQENELSRQRQHRRLLFIALAGTIWFGAFLALFFWNRNRLNKRLALQDSTLQSQKIQQLEQEKKILAMSSMIEGQEAERKRIAQDLHDGLGGLLSSVKAQLNMIQHQVSKLESLDMYQKATSLIDDASSELRRISYNMMPSSLSRLGLKEAIEDLMGNIEKDHDLKVDLQILGLNGRLNETQEIMLYRIIQELCNNVVKHAEASKLLLQINKAQDEIFLIAEDNGKGFDIGSISHSRGVGMKSLESRVKYLNGEIDISSAPGSGTCITVHIPIDKNEKINSEL